MNLNARRLKRHSPVGFCNQLSLKALFWKMFESQHAAEGGCKKRERECCMICNTGFALFIFAAAQHDAKGSGLSGILSQNYSRPVLVTGLFFGRNRCGNVGSARWR
ncbi:hypothetical protein [Novosphingobium sp. PhB165]|uniref:hypothetical protein n=1 Tax=Novosphingobium sp. PhB165 TaxID=2485105 RepID=UPI0014054A62|nr:hypothetical protein [Novosphingobium sp. PhB165]